MEWEKLRAGEIDHAVRAADGTFQVVSSFLALLPVPAFVKDKSGRLLYLNARAEALWKLKSHEAAGKTIPEIFGKEELGAIVRECDRRVLRDRAAHVSGNISSSPHFFTLLFPMIDGEGNRLLGGIVVKTHG